MKYETFILEPKDKILWNKFLELIPDNKKDIYYLADYVNLYNINCKNTKNPEYQCDVLKKILDNCFIFKARKIKMYIKEKERSDN